MPAEVFYGDAGIDLRVSWGVGGEAVQLVTRASGTAQDGSPTERLIVGVVNPWLKEAGLPTINYEELIRLSPVPPDFDGWHMQLEGWREINRLIKTLQRARDRTYGEPA